MLEKIDEVQSRLKAFNKKPIVRVYQVETTMFANGKILFPFYSRTNAMTIYITFMAKNNSHTLATQRDRKRRSEFHRATVALSSKDFKKMNKETQTEIQNYLNSSN